MVSEKTKREARKILELSQKQGIADGKHPLSMAAAALYMCVQKNNENVSQMAISKASGISAVTIRNRVRDLEILKSK